MDKSFHYLSMINQSLFQKKILGELKKIGLTSGQPKVLEYLSYHDGSMQKDIAYGCQIKPATLTGILMHMSEKGLIERRMINGNRRASYIYLTDQGKEKAEKISDVFLEMEEEIFKGIDQDERAQFMDTFFKLCCNMTDTEGLQ